MDFAIRVAKESYCIRKKVGAILVKDNKRIISYGYNGTPTGEDNCCEERDNTIEEKFGIQYKTKPNVVHAEDNVYRKLLMSPESSAGAVLYCTLQPCVFCADLIIESGTKKVIYLDKYKCDLGLIKLLEHNIIVEKY